jgi:N-acetylated-alpha-linked acidic dipeptidase
VKTLPGIREAIEQHKWDEASEQIVVVATTIEQTAAQIDRVTTILKADR